METEVKLTKLANCAGCGAKVSAGTLARLLGAAPPARDANLLVGFEHSDDASAYLIDNERVLLQTVDFFPPIVDDPFTFGRIAAANALSDIYAMGGEPKLAQNLLCVPETMAEETVRAILSGGFDAANEAGVIVTGGHSVFDPVPKYGMCVSGFVHPDKLLTNGGAQPGDVLFLTKPLGVGVTVSAMGAGLATGEGQAAAIASMRTLNKAARDAMVSFPLHACTDVTGFGLIGHALEMAQASGVSVSIDSSALPLLPGALALAQMGLLPAGMYRNRSFTGPWADVSRLPRALADLLFDPQTSGGLLIAAPAACAEELEAALKAAAPLSARIGKVTQSAQPCVTVCST